MLYKLSTDSEQIFNSQGKTNVNYDAGKKYHVIIQI